MKPINIVLLGTLLTLVSLFIACIFELNNLEWDIKPVAIANSIGVSIQFYGIYKHLKS